MMIKLYADEKFRQPAVEELRKIGYDVLTAYEAGQATQQKRVVITYNRQDFIKLHNKLKEHAGIIVCTENHNDQQLAQRVHTQLMAHISLDNKLIRVNIPG